ncbi:MAG: hypothetical protein R6X20_10345 [Phycisphaerae bacterium]
MLPHRLPTLLAALWLLALPLAAGKRYAFLVGILDPVREGNFTLANRNRAASPAPPRLTDPGAYPGGWGLRREGNGRRPRKVPGPAPPAASASALQPSGLGVRPTPTRRGSRGLGACCVSTLNPRCHPAGGTHGLTSNPWHRGAEESVFTGSDCVLCLV